MAPEILEGQPFTVKSDIYALGVILYQFLVGDFHKALSPEWERDIDDELLREDIALAVAPNPAMRLADAEALGAGGFEPSKSAAAQLKSQRKTQARAEDTHAASRERGRSALSIGLAFAALSIGFAISPVMYSKDAVPKNSARMPRRRNRRR